MIIKTTKGELKYTIGKEGGIDMENPQTIAHYLELRHKHPDSKKYGIFFAFSNQQFEEGKEEMRKLGLYKDGQKIYSIGAGGYGVDKKLIDDFFGFYQHQDDIIAQECDPQEVYFYEYNNFECMLDWDGDKRAYELVEGIFGKEVASKIQRI